MLLPRIAYWYLLAAALGALWYDINLYIYILAKLAHILVCLRGYSEKITGGFEPYPKLRNERSQDAS